MSRRSAVGLVLLACAACAGPERGPSDTVLRYLELLPADPVRTLVLTSDAFHLRHGLRFSEVGDQPFRAAAAPATEAPAEDRALALARARFGWLTALTKRVFALQAHRFRHALGEEQIEGDRAVVPVRVEEPGRPPLDAVFRLERSHAAAPWRISAIELGDVADEDLIRAFVLAPDAELNRRILARRR